MNSDNDGDTPRGARRSHNNDRNHDRGARTRSGASPQRPVSDALPNPEMLEAYDYIVEGSARMIIDMFAREQQHRHEWETRALKTHSFSTVLGQVLGFFIALSIFISATVIGIYGDKTTAALVWVFGMAIVVMAGLVWMYAKSMGQRPLFAKPAMRQHFRAEKE